MKLLLPRQYTVARAMAMYNKLMTRLTLPMLKPQL